MTLEELIGMVELNDALINTMNNVSLGVSGFMGLCIRYFGSGYSMSYSGQYMRSTKTKKYPFHKNLGSFVLSQKWKMTKDT